MFEIVEQNPLSARIKAIGVGGGGGNAINTMIGAGLSGVDFIVANTDVQALSANTASAKISNIGVPPPIIQRQPRTSSRPPAANGPITSPMLPVER